MKSVQRILLILSIAYLGACESTVTGDDEDEPTSEDPPATVESVVVLPAADTLLELGATLQLTAAARDGDGVVLSDRTFEWTTSDTAVGTVSADGEVTAVGRGAVTIEAHSEGHSGSADITVMGPFTTLATGILHTCAVAVDGQTYCWGETTQPDDPGESFLYESSVPVPAGGPPFEALTGGVRFTCGLVEGGAAYCWGHNLAGALGDGTAMNGRWEPEPVLGGLAFGHLEAGAEHTCGVTTAGEAYCWGHAGFGRLGVTEQASYFTTPMPVAGGLTFSDLSAGELHTCGVTTEGDPYCWGRNQTGELGDSTTTDRSTPVPVVGDLELASIRAGAGFTCGLTPDGEALCWGSNEFGQLGDGTATDRPTPGPVAGGLRFASIDSDWFVTCGLTFDGAAHCWGRLFEGELSENTIFQASTPERVPGELEFVSVSVGLKHACGLTTFGDIYCWGAGEYGLLGNGTETDSLDPVKVISPFTL